MLEKGDNLIGDERTGVLIFQLLITSDGESEFLHMAHTWGEREPEQVLIPWTQKYRLDFFFFANKLRLRFLKKNGGWMYSAKAQLFVVIAIAFALLAPYCHPLSALRPSHSPDILRVLWPTRKTASGSEEANRNMCVCVRERDAGVFVVLCQQDRNRAISGRLVHHFVNLSHFTVLPTETRFN